MLWMIRCGNNLEHQKQSIHNILFLFWVSSGVCTLGSTSVGNFDTRLLATSAWCSRSRKLDVLLPKSLEEKVGIFYFCLYITYIMLLYFSKLMIAFPFLIMFSLVIQSSSPSEQGISSFHRYPRKVHSIFPGFSSLSQFHYLSRWALDILNHIIFAAINCLEEGL